MGALGQISETSLTRETAFRMEQDGLPNSFVPGRNLLFFTFAAAVAWRRGIRHLVGGMCETDFSGYPDCRDNTIKSLQVALNLGMDRSFALQTPLMWLDKSETWALAQQLGGDPLIELLLEHTHTCYRNDRGPRNDWGHGCGECPACALRKRGFERWLRTLM
jgi:7-cyano-7-deazaguanine synthase